MPPEILQILKDLRAIQINTMSALEILPDIIRRKVQDHIDANNLLLARIGANLKKLGVFTDEK